MRQKPRTAAAELVGARARRIARHPTRAENHGAQKPNFLTRIRSRMKEIALGE